MYDAIIIGGGPAGMTAALYLLRAGKNALILEKESFGGQIARSPRLENYPTIVSISGMEWSDQLFEQVIGLGAEFDIANVEGITKTDKGFVVHTEYGDKECKSVIIATGCDHRKLGLEREDELVGKGISYCATCDGSFFTGKEVLVIGDANTALQYTIALSPTVKKITLITLFDRFFADEILVKRLKALPNLTVFHNKNAIEFLGKDELTGVKFEDTKTKETEVFSCDGAFICIGQVPHNEPFAEFVELSKGFIVTDETMATKTPGIYACGDCREKKIRQVITASSDGAIAGVSCANYLNSL
ncbi:MAG: FAD-dependent oxidoreductase [Bacilli bacterium]|nr:FAD-dependent oxidoreductase [Bacilli bacterium]